MYRRLAAYNIASVHRYLNNNDNIWAKRHIAYSDFNRRSIQYRLFRIRNIVERIANPKKNG